MSIDELNVILYEFNKKNRLNYYLRHCYILGHVDRGHNRSLTICFRSINGNTHGIRCELNGNNESGKKDEKE